MATGLQMVLSRVIGMSQQVEELNALKVILGKPSIITPGSSTSDARDTLASTAGLKAATIASESNKSCNGNDLINANILNFMAIKSNPQMGMAE